MTKQNTTVITADTTRLAATAFIPEKAPKAAVLIIPGVGIKQTFYARFAEFLAGNGFAAYTFDYRGIGQSLHGAIKASTATLLEWGQMDIEGMLQHLQNIHPEQSFHITTHSGGGVILGLAPSAAKAQSIMMVASPRGTHSDYKGWNYVGMGLLSRGLYPLLPRIFGYFPSELLRIGENVPKNVALQWGSVAGQKNGIVDYIPKEANYYTRIKAPCLAWSFDNDFFASKVTVDALPLMYEQALFTRKHVTKETVNGAVVDHFSFFKQESERTLWSLALQHFEKYTLAKAL